MCLYALKWSNGQKRLREACTKARDNRPRTSDLAVFILEERLERVERDEPFGAKVSDPKEK